MATPRTAVLGGSGFIGARLVTTLANQGIRAKVVDIAAPLGGRDWTQVDVRDVAPLCDALSGVDTVYSLVGAHGLGTIPDRSYQSLNVDAAHSVCLAAERCGTSRIVFVSSAAVYGRSPHAPDESATPAPADAYASTKLAAEAVYRSWARAESGRRLVIVRPTVVFGPGAGGVGGRLFRMVARPDFVQVGSARCRKSLAFVGNVAAFLAFVRDMGDPVRVFNYADFPDIELRDLISIVRAALAVSPAKRRSRIRTQLSAVLALFSPQPATSSGRYPGTGRMYATMRFDARLAHSSGFLQPVPLTDAVVQTVRAELAVVTLVARRRSVQAPIASGAP